MCNTIEMKYIKKKKKKINKTDFFFFFLYEGLTCKPNPSKQHYKQENKIVIYLLKYVRQHKGHMK